MHVGLDSVYAAYIFLALLRVMGRPTTDGSNVADGKEHTIKTGISTESFIAIQKLAHGGDMLVIADIVIDEFWLVQNM